MANWNERYKHGQHISDEPHPLVVRFASPYPAGHALDLACGVGRHAIWLAERGWKVTAVDYSNVAIDILRQRATEKGVTVDSRVADLERHEFVIEPRSESRLPCQSRRTTERICGLGIDLVFRRKIRKRTPSRRG